MTEAQLNENIIKNKIKGICQDCIYLEKIVPVINQMLNEEYVKGLGQGKFDKENEKQQLISFLEDKIKERMDTIRINKVEHIEEVDSALTRRLAELNAYQEVLDFVKSNENE